MLKVKPDQQHRSGRLLQTGCLSWSYFDIKIISHKCVTLDTIGRKKYTERKILKKIKNVDSLLAGKCVLGKKKKYQTGKLYS